MSDTKVFNAEEKAKLNQVLREGVSVMTEVEALNEGLNETIKEVAKDMDIKASVLKKAIKTAHKSKFHETTTEYELLENILETTGYNQ